MEESIYDIVRKTSHPHYTYHVAWSWACRQIVMLAAEAKTIKVVEQEFLILQTCVRQHVDHLNYQANLESEPPARRRSGRGRTSEDGAARRRPSPGGGC